MLKNNNTTKVELKYDFLLILELIFQKLSKILRGTKKNGTSKRSAIVYNHSKIS
jgi:hypothetical protein